MRIALVVERFGREAGGVEQVAQNVARALVRAGDEVHVIARAGASAEAEAAATRVGAILHALPIRPDWQPLRVLGFSRAAEREARLERPRFDVVHGFSRTRHLDVYRAGGGSHADYMERAYTGSGLALRRLSPRHRVLLGLESRVFADPHPLIHCVSGLVREQIAGRYRVPDERLVVIHNGVDHERFDPARNAAEAAELRKSLTGDAAAAATTHWLFAGSGAHRKGLDVALHALAASPERDARLWVAGRDAPTAARRLCSTLGIGERVRFLGERRDMPAIYAAADGLLLPTRYDAFANVCLEAAASALPVITSASNGAAELLDDAGVVIERADDAEGFGRAMADLADRERRRALGECGRKLALHHGWDDHAARLRALYRRSIAERPDRARA
jgi:UDP-glucose:(heptosyl)LPS alpha-1,3-glucosyltransferase